MADDEAGLLLCNNPDCRVAETGACVEGFAVDACPRYHPHNIEEHNGGALAQADGVESPGEPVGLAAADALTVEQASALLCASRSRVIAILGPLDSGKTSLIASLYDLFQEAPVADTEFSRSRTLHAFERACHDARSASGRDAPDMTRTPRGGVRFYHLEVSSGVAGHGVALIIGDRSGEEYGDVADDASTARQLSEVVRADVLTVLVDGERLLDVGARHNVRSDVLVMLQALHDGDALPSGARLALVLTKLDEVEAATCAERVNSDFDSLVDQLRGRFGQVLSAIQPFRIAASPKMGALKRGTGVPELLAFWLQPAVKPSKPRRPMPVLERAFARLAAVDDAAE